MGKENTMVQNKGFNKNINTKHKKKKDALHFKVEAENELLKFLYQNVGKGKVKVLLKNKLIRVNKEAITQYNHPLAVGDEVEVNFEAIPEEKSFKDFSIVYEDDDIIVIDKHAGVLSISTARENKRTAFRMLSKHVKLQNGDNCIFIVHRLDRDTSGLMMFAKNTEVKMKLQDNWHDIVTERTYLALVEGKPEPWSNSITSYLHESKAMIVYSSDDPESGQEATTHYKTIKSKGNFALLKVWLETGRKNQIRVHMRDIGHPIVGDKKYGSKIDPIARLGLHAWVLSFKHPVSGKLMEFKTAVPRKFSRIV
jgi:23S rRNA pseudouridine1911/1915/1917 synthase